MENRENLEKRKIEQMEKMGKLGKREMGDGEIEKIEKSDICLCLNQCNNGPHFTDSQENEL